MTNDGVRGRGTVVMAGMPKTGKSTFLGALYHVLESGSGQPIELQVLPHARQHLEGLRRRWLRLEREGRTSSASPILNDLNLRVVESGELLSLRWPDLSGEYFDDMVRLRTLNGEMAEILDEATALIVFIHPDTVTQQPRIHEVNRLAEVVEPGTGEQPEKSTSREDQEEVDWDPMMLPGQVLVVELMQLLLDRRRTNPIRRISIVLSAWDVVASVCKSPKTYVETHLPLFHQFLDANACRFDFRLFGVSALGGDPDEDKDTLNAHIDPVDRIHVVDDKGAQTDDGILTPLRWLIEIDDQ